MGQVFPSSLLSTSHGDGLAVSGSGIAGLYYRIVPAAEIVAPVNGAVTAAEERNFRLRTPDGLEITVSLSGSAEYFLTVGELAAAGEPVCRISREAFRKGVPGAAVTFCDSGKITELHVHSGIKRAGDIAAEYKLLQ